MKNFELDSYLHYQILDFHDRVQKSSNAPYVRDVVLLDFLIDSLKFNYDIAEKFLGYFLDEGYLAYDSHGAFPGSNLTTKGIEYLENLRKKYGKSL